MLHPCCIYSTYLHFSPYLCIPSSTLFPYTTLFRSVGDGLAGPAEVADHLGVHPVRLGPAALAQHVAGPLERPPGAVGQRRSEEHTSELQSLTNLVCRLLLEKKKNYALRSEQTLY